MSSGAPQPRRRTPRASTSRTGRARSSGRSVAAAGYTFAFGRRPRARRTPTRRTRSNRTGAESAGLTFGAYHFGRPGGSGDAGIIANAIAQADYFLDVAQPQAGELPPVLDLETKGALAVAGAPEVDARVARPGRRAHRRRRRSSTRRRASGRPRSATRSDVADAGYPLWIAHWTTNASPLVPAEAGAGTTGRSGSTRATARVPGITPQVDLDRFRGADASVAAIRGYPTGLPQPSAAPTIVGTAQTGKTLAAVPGAWAGGKPVVFAYQWQRCDAAGAGCAPIVGATAETYLPVDRRRRSRAHRRRDRAERRSERRRRRRRRRLPSSSSGSTVDAPGRDVGADRQRHAAGRPDAVAHRRLWTGSPTAFTYQWRRCSRRRDAVRRDRRRDGVVVHADAGRHRRDDLARRHRDRPRRLDVGARADDGHGRRRARAGRRPGLGRRVSRRRGRRVDRRRQRDGHLAAGRGAGRLDGVAHDLGPGPRSRRLPRRRAAAVAGRHRVRRADGRTSSATSTDNKVWHVAPQLLTPALPVAQLAGTYVDGSRAHPRPPADARAHRALRAQARGATRASSPQARRSRASSARSMRSGCATASSS